MPTFQVKIDEEQRNSSLKISNLRSGLSLACRAILSQKLDHFIIFITTSSSRIDVTFLGKLAGQSYRSVFLKQGSYPLLNGLHKKGFTHFSGHHSVFMSKQKVELP